MQCNDDEGEYEPHQRAKPGYRGEEYDREDEQVMGHSVKRAWVIHLKTKCDPLSSRHA